MSTWKYIGMPLLNRKKMNSLENLLTIEKLRSLCDDKTIIMTQHLINRARERGIKYDDIKNAILSGEIIEGYSTDYPYPSCLILGMSTSKKQLHAVVGIGDEKLWIITAYYPSLEKWESDYKTRKVEK